MASSNQEISLELLPLLRVYKNVERLMDSKIVLPSQQDTETGVSSKDITISEDFSISARLYSPELTTITSRTGQLQRQQKFSLLLYFHGRGFFASSPPSPLLTMFT
ncbi:hypothetical protein BVC80_9013g19 [Macleaya cordata]|uniref:Uncharacterized protein n=1 Tax=Macleaya cordata TaxID=56857 RepID=A0A200QQ23_MACCD|nr:hypothetical protein BVC80_9013g19 [Macleaya cordata]